uniref:ABC transporter ATP-binding protein n=1 Tax=Thermofilum pendens TaxID=2269 RepID=A0A7C4D4I5_THEPE
MEKSILEVRSLSVWYDVPPRPLRAVDKVSFLVRRGEILGLAGVAPCRESTLAQAILRLLKPPGRVIDGEVLFEGVDLLRLNEQELRRIRWKQISYVPQSSMNALNPVMRIRDQIIDVFKTHEGSALSKEELSKRVEELLTRVGLAEEVSKMFPHELSGGMRQRVVIAMALALRPQLLIADEPTTALDVVVQRGILQLLKDINVKDNTTVMLITHDMAVHAEVTDRVMIMYAGKIVESGPTLKLFSEPLHPYTKLLISSIPRIREKRKIIGITGLPPDLRMPPPGCRFHPRCPHFIKGKCDMDEPVMRRLEPDRWVACHLYS